MRTPEAEDGGESEALRWRCCPLADEFPRSLVFVATFVGVVVAVRLAFGGFAYALLAAGLLAASLARYFLPTAFRLDDAGVTVRFLGRARRLPWEQVRRVSVQPTGVFLSPSEGLSRVDSFRGMFVRFGGNADEVVRFVRSKANLETEAA